jgi:hypothetical protein
MSLIAAGAMAVVPSPSRIYSAIVDGTGASTNLDTIAPAANCVLQTGDILYLRIADAARDVVLRDIATSGATPNGIHTPGNASITLGLTQSVVTLMYTGTNWSVVTDTLS